MSSIFYKRLKTLRKEANKHQEDLATILNVKRATISAYETNKVMPPYDKLKMLGDYFGVSVEYLTGQTDSRQTPTTVDVSQTLRNLVEQIKENDSKFTIDGIELDDYSKELLINSLESSLKLGKLLVQSKKDQT